MTLRLTFGVDPGLSGAVVVLADGMPAAYLDMPTFHNGTANEVKASALAEWIRVQRAAHAGAQFLACIERVRAMPDRSGGGERKMGAQSSFNFGEGFGQVKATFRVLGMSPVMVEAQSWKRYFGLKGAEKDVSRILAIQRYPSAEPWLSRKKDHGRAEALLIAAWAHETEQATRRLSA